MTNATGIDTPEVSGLTSALEFATTMATNLAAQVPVTEKFVTDLRSFEVEGDAVTYSVQAQEKSQAASAAWEEVRAALEAQLGVREAYLANPGAGSKEFVTGE